jgi:hypothetical protein
MITGNTITEKYAKQLLREAKKNHIEARIEPLKNGWGVECGLVLIRGHKRNMIITNAERKKFLSK